MNLTTLTKNSLLLFTAIAMGTTASAADLATNVEHMLKVGEPGVDFGQRIVQSGQETIRGVQIGSGNHVSTIRLFERINLPVSQNTALEFEPTGHDWDAMKKQFKEATKSIKVDFHPEARLELTVEKILQGDELSAMKETGFSKGQADFDIIRSLKSEFNPSKPGDIDEAFEQLKNHIPKDFRKEIQGGLMKVSIKLKDEGNNIPHRSKHLNLVLLRQLQISADKRALDAALASSQDLGATLGAIKKLIGNERMEDFMRVAKNSARVTMLPSKIKVPTLLFSSALTALAGTSVILSPESVQAKVRGTQSNKIGRSVDYNKLTQVK